MIISPGRFKRLFFSVTKIPQIFFRPFCVAGQPLGLILPEAAKELERFHQAGISLVLWRIINVSKWLITMVRGCSPSKWPFLWLIKGGY